jgi:glycosyltransferase involved in cell wall biosynthesis
VDVRTGLESEGAFVHPLTIAEVPVPGVNLVGFLEGEFGVGEIARRLGSALQRAEVPFSAISYRRTPNRQEHPVGLRLAGEAAYDTNVICLNPDALAAFVSDVGCQFFARRHSVGVWFWETDVFPSEHRTAARFLDEIWVASEYVRRAVADVVDIPVHVVPVPVEPPRGPFRSRAELGLPDRFTFLFLFDFVSAERKNPWAVVEAFKSAFAPGEGPVLVLKSINGRDRKPHLLEKLVAVAAGREDIVVRDGYGSAAARDSYLAACDCFVSLHRSEGYGLTMAEAMAFGKPVVATGYSANLEFMDETNSYLVPYELVDVPGEWWAYVPGARWAEPDVQQAAKLMRLVYDDDSESQERGERGRADILRRFALERTGQFISERLETARTYGVDLAGARAPTIEASLMIAQGIGVRLGDERPWHPVGLVRRALIRALWPQLSYQHRLDAALVEALSRLQREKPPLADDAGPLGDDDQTALSRRPAQLSAKRVTSSSSSSDPANE